MIIVGISGAIGSGKSTLASMLTAIDPAHSAHLETSTLVIAVANEFNKALAPIATHLADAEIETINTALEQITPSISVLAGVTLSLSDIAVQPQDIRDNPAFYEKLFVYSKAVQAAPALLSTPIIAANKASYRALLQWLGGYLLYILIDPLLWYKALKRQINEMNNVNFVAITAPRQPAEAEYVQSIGGKVILIERPTLISDRSDITERRVAEIKPDIHVINDGSLEELHRCAEVLRKDLEVHMPRATYHSGASA